MLPLGYYLVNLPSKKTVIHGHTFKYVIMPKALNAWYLLYVVSNSLIHVESHGVRNETEGTGGIVNSMFTVVCKWLILKGMRDYCVSAGMHTLRIQRTPPLRYMGVYVRYTELYIKVFFYTYVSQCLYSFYSGLIFPFALASGFGGRGGLLTISYLQISCIEAYNSIRAFKVVLGGAGGKGTISSYLSLSGHPGGYYNA